MKRLFYGIIITFIFLISIWMFEIKSGMFPYVDQWTRFIVEMTEDTIVYDFFYYITNFGSRPFVEPFTIIMAFFLWWLYRSILPAVFFAGGTLGSHMINKWIKSIIARERPNIVEEANALGYSFPSGHAMISIVCYGLLLYFLLQKSKTHKQKISLQIGLISLILLVGISRFFINVHYLTDILTGYFLGFLLLTGFIYLFKFIQHKKY